MNLPPSRIDASNHIQVPSQLPTETASAVGTLFTVLLSLVGLINGRISAGSGDHLSSRGNLEGTTYDVLTPSTPDTDFAVLHKLGYTPQRCAIVRADKAAVIYDSPILVRDESVIWLRCTVASASLKLEIY